MKYYTKQWHENRDILRDQVPFSTLKAYIDEMNDKYRTYYRALLEQLPKGFEYVTERFHDFTVISNSFSSNDYHLELNHHPYPTNTCGIIFMNAVIADGSERFRNGYSWLSDELYINDDGRYEIHVLMEDRRPPEDCTNRELSNSTVYRTIERIETIITCDDIRLWKRTTAE